MWLRIRKSAAALLAFVALAVPAAAQTSASGAISPRVQDRLVHLFAPEPLQQSITIPNTFVNGTVADATQVNANFTALASAALNRNGGTMLGTLNSRALTPTSDATYDVGTSVLRYRDGWFSRNGSFAGTLAVTGAATFSSTFTINGLTYTWPASQSASAFLQTNGSGTLVWQSSQPPRGCDVRLTLVSGTPITVTDATAVTSIYATPYVPSGGPAYCATYDGSSTWTSLPLTELTQALGTLVNGQAYDVFLYNNAGVLATELNEWANATVTMTIAAPGVVTWTAHGMATGNSITFTTTGALPTGLTANTVYYITVVDANTFKLSTSLITVGAGTFITTSGSQSGVHTGHQPQARKDAIVGQNGVPVKTGATTRRLVGAFFTTTTTTTEDSTLKRDVSNYYNTVCRPMRVTDSTASWSWGTNAFQQANASTANQLEALFATAEHTLDLSVSHFGGGAAGAGNEIRTAIGDGSTTTADAAVTGGASSTAGGGGYTGGLMTGRLNKVPTAGLHHFLWLEKSNGGVAVTWNAYGTGTNGLSGCVMN